MIDIDREKAEAFLSNTIKLHDEWAADRTAQAFSTPFKAWLAAKYPCEVIAVPAVATSAPSTLAEQVARARAVMATWSPEVRASVRLEGGDSAPAASVPELQFKDHNVRELVNDLRDIAVKFHAAQQLRARISEAVGHFLARGIAAPAAPEGQAERDSHEVHMLKLEVTHLRNQLHAAETFNQDGLAELPQSALSFGGLFGKRSDYFSARQMRQYGMKCVAAVPRQAAVAGEQPTLTPKWAGQFDSFAHWVRGAQTSLSSPSHRPAVCIDSKGRRCTIGKDMMLARDEGAFPVRYFWEFESSDPVSKLKRADGEA